MFPILFEIPLFGLFGQESLPIHGYGLMVALGFLVGSWVVQRDAKSVGENPAQALDLIFYILIAAILGSRILHVLVSERDLFFQNPLHMFKIWQGGLVFYGGFIASCLIGIWFIKRHHLPAWKYFDLCMPGFILGHSIGRLGCVMAGCCHGRPLLEKTWYSITFPANISSLAPAGIPLYPTQLLESLTEFLLFLFLSWLLPRKQFEGQLVSLYLIFYALFRFFNEFLRGDVDRGFVFGTSISTSQFIAMILFAVGRFLYHYKGKSRQGVAA